LGSVAEADFLQMSLRPLREDIALYRGPARPDGSPTWTLHDPVRNLFFRIGWLEFHLLSAWGAGTVGAVIERVNRSTTLRATAERMAELLQFLGANQLLRASGPRAREQLVAHRQAARKGAARWLLQNYLFLRIPLVRPDRFLSATLPYLRFVYTRSFALALTAVAVLGLFLVSRQWTSFSQTFTYLFSMEGALVFGIALFLAKAVHELGHAYTAKRYGVRVPTMGVAFLVLWPVLYTDTSEAWKLPDRHQRIAIAAAGMTAELGLAALATLLWSFLPEGPLRGAVFLIATTTWVLTLLINLSPMMRFDGYYLLSDLLEIENLHQRSFQLGKWKLRQVLLGLDVPCPEPLPERRRRFLIGFAYAVWAYRLGLFLGIALLVYHFFFKAIGIFLMLTEITWFVALPIQRELRAWWRLREHIRWNRHTAFTALALGALLLALVLPWSRHVDIPSLLLPQDQARVYGPVAGRLSEVLISPGDEVRAQQPLFRLTSPDVDHRLRQARAQIEVLQLQIARAGAQSELLDYRLVLEQQLAEARADLKAAQDEQARLEIRAPIAGTVSDLEDWLHEGRWLPDNHPLALIVGDHGLRLEGLVGERDLDRLSPGARGYFYPENTDLAPLKVRLVLIDRAGVATLDRPYLASTYGGPIPVREDASHKLVPEQALYRLSLTPEQPGQMPERIERGTLRLEAAPRSPLSRLWETIAGVLIRESGF